MLPEFTGDIRVIYESERLVAIDKPAGMLSAPGKGPEKQDCAVRRVRERFPRAAGPVLVHRLDMETSGLLVMALDAQTHRELSGQFERREPVKRYIGMLRGDPRADEGEIRLFQRPDIENRPRQILDDARGREALTRWRALQRIGAVARVEFTPTTGRSHQLRIAAATPREKGGLGCPIVGDTLYGGGRDEHPRMLLHAERLGITDPATGERLVFESPAPF